MEEFANESFFHFIGVSPKPAKSQKALFHFDVIFEFLRKFYMKMNPCMKIFFVGLGRFCRFGLTPTIFSSDSESNSNFLFLSFSKSFCFSKNFHSLHHMPKTSFFMRNKLSKFSCCVHFYMACYGADHVPVCMKSGAPTNVMFHCCKHGRGVIRNLNEYWQQCSRFFSFKSLTSNSIGSFICFLNLRHGQLT